MTQSPAQPTQLEFWNGPSAQRWAEKYEALDRALAPFGEASLDAAAVRAGESALDVGTGCGGTLMKLAELVGPRGRACGVDISAPMLARARERAAGIPQASLIEADAGRHRFAEPFDLVYSRFGLMFFEDPVSAFQNLRGALKADGRLIFVCWRAPEDNPWYVLPMQAIRSAWPDAPAAPASDGPGPYAFADAEKVRGILVRAGFAGIRVERFDADVVLGRTPGEALEFAVSAGPAARMLADAPGEVRERVRIYMSAALEPVFASGRYALRGSTWIVGARCG